MIDHDLGMLPEGVTTKTYAGCIEVFENVFSVDTAKKLIEIFEDSSNDSNCPNDFDPATMNFGEDGRNIRSNRTMNVDHHLGINNEPCTCRVAEAEAFIREKLTPCVNFYQRKYDVEIGFDEGLQLLRYSPGQEYKAHTDYGPGSEYRVVSALIYINPGQYDGGGTSFINYDINLKVETPSIALFPSNYAYKHAAKPVFSGYKYAIVTWLGPPWLSPRK